MTKEEKLAFAKKFYDDLNLTDYKLEIGRDDEIRADYVCVPDMRGPSGLIIGDGGSYIFCQSAHGYSYWKEKFKKGVRDN